MGNLAFIGENGIEKFLQREKVRWTCSDCGGVISVHDGLCYGCGKNYTDRKHYNDSVKITEVVET